MSGDPDRGVWMTVRGGHCVYLNDPKPEDFDPERIAYGLAHEHRFCGNYGPYSVAQHAVLVSETCGRYGGAFNTQLAALHHDDAESILGDLPSPVKGLCPDFRVLERRLEACLQNRFNIDIYAPHVRVADRVVFCGEVRCLVPPKHQVLYGDYGNPCFEREKQPTRSEFAFWTPDFAAKRYLERHEVLCASVSEEAL